MLGSRYRTPCPDVSWCRTERSVLPGRAVHVVPGDSVERCRTCHLARPVRQIGRPARTPGPAAPVSPRCRFGPPTLTDIQAITENGNIFRRNKLVVKSLFVIVLDGGRTPRRWRSPGPHAWDRPQRLAPMHDLAASAGRVVFAPRRSFPRSTAWAPWHPQHPPRSCRASRSVRRAVRRRARLPLLEDWTGVRSEPARPVHPARADLPGRRRGRRRRVTCRRAPRRGAAR